MIDTIIVGALSGVIATIICLFFQSYFKKVTVPWFQKLFYKGVEIAGKWEYLRNISDTSFEDAYLNIKQYADNIKGTFSIIGKVFGMKELITYDISGYIQNRFVVVATSPTHNDSILHYTFLLKIKDEIDGLRLEGRLLFYDDKTNSVLSDILYFKRKTA